MIFDGAVGHPLLQREYLGEQAQGRPATLVKKKTVTRSARSRAGRKCSVYAVKRVHVQFNTESTLSVQSCYFAPFGSKVHWNMH